MEDGMDKKEELNNSEREEIYSQAVRAGKRTYFFDVKATRRNDYYLTITESKKRFNREGRFFYEKHKVFLYKEDFDKFSDALKTSIDYILENRPEMLEAEPTTGEKEKKVEESALTENYTNVDFEDLEEKKE